MAAKMFPNEETKYRYINEKMDRELIIYRKEIERRFRKGEMQHYKFLRVDTGYSEEKSKRSYERKTQSTINESTIDRDETNHQHATHSNISIKLSKYVQKYEDHSELLDTGNTPNIIQSKPQSRMSAFDREMSNVHKGSMGEHDTRHSII